MLGIIIPYHSFFELCPFQIKNIRRFVKVQSTILIVDDSDLEDSPLSRICEELEVLYWKVPPAQHQLFGENPSARHQHAVNTGLEILRDFCSHILIFDNDMIFVEDFKPLLDKTLWYVPQKRGTLVYPWLNLFLFATTEKIYEFKFNRCPQTGEPTDSGGSVAGYLLERSEDCRIIEYEFRNDTYLVNWQNKFRELCEKYQTQCWYEIYHFLGTSVFHFRGLSNWQKLPLVFLDDKKALILEALSEFQNTY